MRYVIYLFTLHNLLAVETHRAQRVWPLIKLFKLCWWYNL